MADCGLKMGKFIKFDLNLLGTVFIRAEKKWQAILKVNSGIFKAGPYIGCVNNSCLPKVWNMAATQSFGVSLIVKVMSS